MPQHIADFALDAILTLSASWATHVSACQQAQVRNLWNFKNFANLNAWSTEAQMYVAASNGFASFPVLWLLTRPIGWPGCWCMPVRNVLNFKNGTHVKSWSTKAHNLLAARDLLCCLNDLSFLVNPWVDKVFVDRQRGEKCTEFQKWH